jgi:hypothetical protein
MLPVQPQLQIVYLQNPKAELHGIGIDPDSYYGSASPFAILYHYQYPKRIDSLNDHSTTPQTKFGNHTNSLLSGHPLSGPPCQSSGSWVDVGPGIVVASYEYGYCTTSQHTCSRPRTYTIPCRPLTNLSSHPRRPKQATNRSAGICACLLARQQMRSVQWKPITIRCKLCMNRAEQVEPNILLLISCTRKASALQARKRSDWFASATNSIANRYMKRSTRLSGSFYLSYPPVVSICRHERSCPRPICSCSHTTAYGETPHEIRPVKGYADISASDMRSRSGLSPSIRETVELAFFSPTSEYLHELCMILWMRLDFTKNTAQISLHRKQTAIVFGARTHCVRDLAC